MSSKPMNLVVIMADEHTKQMLGCYGHPVVQTPNLDKLAQNGVRFTNAYTNSPICVPARASFATGRYAHEIGTWDNAAPYIGQAPSWGHRLTKQGFNVTTIGKLHYRDDQDDIGFPDIRLSFHVLDRVGDVYSLIRNNMDRRPINREKITEAGIGNSSYNRFDKAVGLEAQNFLRHEATNQDKPWVLFVSFASPHFPYIVPKQYFDKYPLDSVILPRQYSLAERPRHPALEEYRRVWCTDDEFDDYTLRKVIAAYYGLCSFVDDQVGDILQTINESGLENNTRIIYTTDHGDALGDHGVWFKSTMYESSASIPFIMAGPDIPKGKVAEDPISLIDCFPTIIEAVGANYKDEDYNLPGTSLLPIARGEERLNRTIYSEYHAMGFSDGVYMIRYGKYKYIHYVNNPAQLFDLELDPNELNDLSDDPSYKDIKLECERELRSIVNPEDLDSQAKKDQAKRIKDFGGREAILDSGFKVPYSPVPVQFR